MINLKVSGFCHDCQEFEADVERNIFYIDNPFEDRQFSVSTEVTCVHEQRCRSMMEYLKTKQGESASQGVLRRNDYERET